MVSSDQQQPHRRSAHLLPVSSGERTFAGAEGQFAWVFSGSRILPNLVEVGKPDVLPLSCTIPNKIVKVRLS